MKLLYPGEPSLVQEIEKKLRTLRDAWADYSLELPELPSEERLAEILTTLFYLGLSKEEERPCKVSMIFVESQKPHSFEHIKFAAPSDFSLENIRKISLAFDVTKTLLCVEEKNEQLQIWGVARTPPAHAAIFRNNREGEILIDFGSESAFRFYQGHVTFFHGDWKHIGKRLSILVNSNLPKEQQEKNLTFFPKVKSICSIASYMLAHGHGGCLLVVENARSINKDILYIKPSNTWEESTNSFLRNKLTDFINFEIDRYENPPKAHEVWTKENQRKQLLQDWRESVEFVGRLSAVDGAVVLASDLSLIGFGAIIKPDADDVEKTKIYLYKSILNPQDKREMSVSQLGGTRHKTAVAFVKKQANSFAFVASQDGILSFIFKDPNGEHVSILTNLDFVIRDIR